MKRFTSIAAFSLALGSLLVVGCSCSSGPDPNADGGLGDIDAFGQHDAHNGIDGNGFDVNAPPVDAFNPIDGNGFDVVLIPMDTNVPPGPDGNGFDVGPGGCFAAMCQSHLYQCGNCLDDDNDGLI